MAHQLKLFFDRGLKDPVTKFAFPRTDVGYDAFIDFYMHNASEKWPIVDIEPEGLGKQTTVVNLPQVLPPQKTVHCRLKWTPSTKTDEPLSEITTFTGNLQIGA